MGGIIGCCPLVAVIVSISVMGLYVSRLGLLALTLQAGLRPRLLITGGAATASSSRRLKADILWFALTHRSTLDGTVKQVMERAGQVITVYKKGSRVAA